MRDLLLRLLRWMDIGRESREAECAVDLLQRGIASPDDVYRAAKCYRFHGKVHFRWNGRFWDQRSV